MDDWTLTDWSEGTKGLDRLLAKRRRTDGVRLAILFAIGLLDLLIEAYPAYYGLFGREFVTANVGLFGFVTLLWSVFGSADDPENKAGVRFDLPVTVPQYPVTVVYKRGRQQYGEDRGVMMFAGGSMVFQGVRSRFSFGGSLRLRVDMRMRMSGGPRVYFDADGAEDSVTINPSLTFLGKPNDMRYPFSMEVDAWRTWKGEEATDRIAPPLTPHRDAVKSSAISTALFPAFSLLLVGMVTAWAPRMSPADKRIWLPTSTVLLAVAASIAAMGVIGAVRWIGLWRRTRGKTYAPGYGGVTLGREEDRTFAAEKPREEETPAALNQVS